MVELEEIDEVNCTGSAGASKAFFRNHIVRVPDWTPRTTESKPCPTHKPEFGRLIAAGIRSGTELADAGSGLSAALRQGFSGRGITWVVGIPKHQKIYPMMSG